MNPATDKEIYKFLVNSDFVDYVLSPNQLLKKTWENFFNYNPHLISIANDAKKILLGQIIYRKLTPSENSLLRNGILNSILV